MNPNDIRLIAFYLPQYHPIPENDEWWGKGFTEWTNVVRAQPRFRGHYQPRIPSELGFYDLRVPEVREAQAQLARDYGISGFCYYHYWFNGRRLLERPFNEVLASGRPNFPFCLCWANENWTRTWDGGDREILIGQNYSHEDDRAHIRSLLPALRDERYIRIGGKPLLLLYRTELLPDPARTAEIWREAARKDGIGDIYLARVESFEPRSDPRSIGFDAAVEFAPDWRILKRLTSEEFWHKLAVRLHMVDPRSQRCLIAEYDALIKNMLAKPVPGYRRFRCVSPGFDNTSRRAWNGAVFVGSTPENYGAWLRAVVELAKQEIPDEGDRIVFLNAWNEWGEGNYLEPDLKYGRAYLEATRRAISGNA